MRIHLHAPPTRLSFNSCMWEELLKAEPSWPSTDHVQSPKALDGEYYEEGGEMGGNNLLLCSKTSFLTATLVRDRLCPLLTGRRPPQHTMEPYVRPSLFSVAS